MVLALTKSTLYIIECPTIDIALTKMLSKVSSKLQDIHFNAYSQVKGLLISVNGTTHQ